jgi:spore maturation protein SpmA
MHVLWCIVGTIVSSVQSGVMARWPAALLRGTGRSMSLHIILINILLYITTRLLKGASRSTTS